LHHGGKCYDLRQLIKGEKWLGTIGNRSENG
jgi:hypothetical protein